MSAELPYIPDNLDQLPCPNVDQHADGFMRRFASSVAARCVLAGAVVMGIGAVADSTEAQAVINGETQIAYDVTTGGYTHMDAVFEAFASLPMEELPSEQATGLSRSYGIRRRMAAFAMAVTSSMGIVGYSSSPVEAASSACASTGDACVWGSDGYEQFGIDIDPGTTIAAPMVATSLKGVVDVAVGGYRGNALGVQSDGSVYEWGQGSYTTLGGSPTPQKVSGITDGTAVAASTANYVLKKDGTVAAWGNGWNGQLGDGNIGFAEQTQTPSLVKGLDNVKDIAAAGVTGFALLKDGTVKSWGDGRNGTLGNGTDGVAYPHGSAEPVVVSGLKDISDIAATGKDGFALDKNGRVWGWGQNTFGLLGPDKPAGDALTPHQITGLSDIVEISAQGDETVYALDSSGRVWMWGADFGSSGGGDCHDNTSYFVAPRIVPGLPKMVSVSGISTNGYGIEPNGTAWAWGSNWNGLLGNGDSPLPGANPTCSLPAKIGGIGSVSKIIPGYASFAIGGKPTAPSPQYLKYVALGDSYSSGEGAPNPKFIIGTDQKGNLCHRSSAAYPELIYTDRIKQFSELIFRACSGATIADLTHSNVEGNSNEPAQLSWLDSDTSLVTISIGGNDVGFADVMTYCASRGSHYPSCQSKYGKVVDKRIADISSTDPNKSGTLLSVYKAIRQKAPNAQVIVAGYPRIFPSSPPSTCKTGVGNITFTQPDMKWLNVEGSKLDGALRKITALAGFTYADTQNVLNGHELCTTDPYINRVIIDASNPDIFKLLKWSFHPKLKGQLAMSRIVSAQIK